MTTAEAAPDIAAIEAQWTRWRDGETQNGRYLATNGDPYRGELRLARAQALDLALTILRNATGPAEAAGAIHYEARRYTCHSLTPPLLGFDQAAMDHTRARKLQRCAQDLDPSLPEVEPLW